MDHYIYFRGFRLDHTSAPKRLFGLPRSKMHIILLRNFAMLTGSTLELKLNKDTYVSFVRPNKKISAFRVTGLKILGRVGTHFFLKHFFFWKKI